MFSQEASLRSPISFSSALVLLVSQCRRQLIHMNVTAHPTEAWVWRELIEATPWRKQPKFLIRDRACCYGGNFSGT